MAKKSTIPSYRFEKTSHPNVKRVVDMDGDWTHYYLVKEKIYVKAVNHILYHGYTKGPRFNEYLLSITKDEQQKVLKERGDIGTRTHIAISDLIYGVKLTMDRKYPSEVRGRQDRLTIEEWKNLMAFKNWCELYSPRLIRHEFAVFSREIGYAGTDDALLIITVPSGSKVFEKQYWGEDVLLLPDWKSGAGIWDEYQAQVAAYLHAAMEMGTYKQFFNAFKGKIFTGIVRVGSRHANGYEFKIWNERESLGHNFNLFLAAKTIADNAGEGWEPQVEQIPTTLSIKMPKAKVVKPKKAKTKKK